MSWSWTYFGLIALAFTQPVVSSEICVDGGAFLCSDGSKPTCVTSGSSACPKACDPHYNKCDITAPTCIFPDPRVTGPRGACACRPGYKATGYTNNDYKNQWRLPVEAQEHRVWVAEGVKCDTLCDVSTGVDSCLEITLLAAECVGTGAAGYNTSQQSMPIIEGAYGNHSRSLTGTKTETKSETFAEPTGMTESTSEGLDTATFDTDDPDEAADHDAVGEIQDTKEDVFDEKSPPSGDDSMDIPEGLDLDGDDTSNDPGEPTSDADNTSEDSGDSNLADAPVIDGNDEITTVAEDTPIAPDSSSDSVIEARDLNTPWSQVAEEKGRERYKTAWTTYMKAFTGNVAKVDTARRPDLCSAITRSIVDSCKKGVRVQVASCKQALRDKIARCKNDIKARVDRCKRSKSKWDPRKLSCEISRSEVEKCELARVDIPFCEFDRLTAGCCEGTRTQAKTMCAAGISTGTIQRQIQSIQATCSMGTGLAKAATKSYLTGQVLGVIIQLESIKGIGDSVQAVRKAEQIRKEMEQWANGLAAAARGNMRDAESNLGSLLSQISPQVGKTLNWAQAAQAVVTKNVDAAAVKAIAAAGELQAIQSARKSIKALETVANDVNAIQAAARKCASVPKPITPEGYPHWKDVKSEEMLDSAVEAYVQAFSKRLEGVAKCQAVFVRIKRLLPV